MNPFFIFLIIVIPLVLFFALSCFLQEQRRKELSRWAAGRGFSFDASHKSSWMHDQLYSFSCLSKGDHRYAYNIMQGKVRDRPILAFDWHYELGGDGKNETHNDHYFSAVIVQPGVVLKPLLIRSETFFDKIGEVFGLGAIELESAEFNRRFHVTSPDRRWAFDVLPQTTMEFLLASPHFTLEIQDFCILAHTGSVFSTAEFESALSVLNGFLDRIPPSVIQDLKDVHA